MSELKPCPFCGKPAKLETNGYNNFLVTCIECFGESELAGSAGEATLQWNTRPGEDAASQKQFEEDCKALNKCGLHRSMRLRALDALQSARENTL